MARKLTQVQHDDLIKIAENLGLEIVENKSFTKCYKPGSRRQAVGVPNTRSVTRVELVGFTHNRGIAHPKPPAKTVEQMLDFDKGLPEILTDFYAVCAEGLLGMVLDAQDVKVEVEQPVKQDEQDVQSVSKVEAA